MQEITISRKEEGQQLIKLLSKYLTEAPQSFFYKMLRKKNITLNGKKAEGKEKVAAGDRICLYLADDTIRLFGGSLFFEEVRITPETIGKVNPAEPKKGMLYAVSGNQPEAGRITGERFGFSVLYEDEDILLVNKPAGLLTQKAALKDISLNEKIQEYLLAEGALSLQDLKTFHPGVCNRLDRNTSGIVSAGKSIAGLQFLSGAFRERSLKKYYYCMVSGEILAPVLLNGYLKKDDRENKVSVIPESGLQSRAENGRPPEGYERIRTAYRPLAVRNGFTLLEVDLITGKPHQIRAHLASQGHGILGDSKYGSPAVNGQMRKKFGLKYQLLHAGRLVFGSNPERFSYLDGKEVIADEPEQFRQIKEELFG